MLYVIIGFLSGIISGMGIGGGAILIPALVLFTPLTQQNAQGINLIVFIPAAITALFIHHKNKKIEYKFTIPIIISGVISAVGGSVLAIYTSPEFLKTLFGVFLFIIGIVELIGKPKPKKKA